MNTNIEIRTDPEITAIKIERGTETTAEIKGIQEKEIMDETETIMDETETIHGIEIMAEIKIEDMEEIKIGNMAETLSKRPGEEKTSHKKKRILIMKREDKSRRSEE